MRTIALYSALALGVLTSAALTEPATTTPATSAVTATAPVKVAPGQAGRLGLNDRQMDGVKAGSPPTSPPSAGAAFSCTASGGRSRAPFCQPLPL
jgi:hypothetical protein